MAVKIAVLVGLALAAFVIVLFLPPMRQEITPYAYVDQRPALGIPNFLNVVSNFVFLGVGVAGLVFLLRKGGEFRQGWERGPYAVLFTGLIFVAAGSTYYHLDPNAARIFWDRLPMTVVFMSVLGVTIIERLSPRIGAALFVPLLLAGAVSLLWWRHSGDLRFYGLVQFGSLSAVPLLLVMFPATYTRTIDLYIALGGYALSKVCELFDAQIYGCGRLVSGHTLKHLLAGTAMAWLLLMLRRRRILVNI